MSDDVKNLSVGELLFRAEEGDPAAQAAIEDFGRDVEKIGEAFRADGPTARFAGINEPRVDITALEEAGESIAAARREAVEREEAMISELTAMRRSTEAADRRADAAEDREREALELARRNYRVAVVAAIVTVLSLAATVVVAVLA